MGGAIDEWLVASHGIVSAKETARPIGRSYATDLQSALEVLGVELARDMPDDVREDVAELLAKLARRRGAQRHQSELLTLLTAPSEKRQRVA
jgi:hypothetical protein